MMQLSPQTYPATISFIGVLLVSVFLTSVPLTDARAGSPTETATTLVHHITGYTMDDGKVVKFIGLEFSNNNGGDNKDSDAGRVLKLYKTGKALAKRLAALPKSGHLDGNGATLLPGLIDAHGHISSYARSLTSVDLLGSASESEAAERVAAYARRHAGHKWILGRGWNQVLWKGQSLPTRDSLDRALQVSAAAKAGGTTTAGPAMLKRVDGHAVWVNSEALRLAGIDRKTPDPDGGQIVRDAHGRATGVLIDNAMNLILAQIPDMTDEATAELLQSGLRSLASYGLTSVHDAGITAREVRAYQSLRRQHLMPIRIYAMLDVFDPDNEHYLNNGPLIDLAGKLTVTSIKILADGALGSRGAALFDDYSDQPGNKGLLVASDKQLMHYMGLAMGAGFQVNVHAIGDRANARVLGYFEALLNRMGNRRLRHRIEHAQVIRLSDMPDFRRLGIIASVQPTHATSDKNMAGDRLGEARLKGAYAWATLREHGIKLAGGSDFPVESPNPFFGLHAAVTRQDHDNLPEGGWLPKEKVSRAVALSMFTENAAYAALQEQLIGTLLPGHAADFILVRDDYFEVPAEDIWKNKVLATYVAGVQVFPHLTAPVDEESSH